MKRIGTDQTLDKAVKGLQCKIVVVVLCGPGRSEQVKLALESAMWGDHYILVQPKQPGAAETVAAAARVLLAKLWTMVQVDWDGFSVARQAGHDAAEKLGAAWIVTLDTDQVLTFPNAREVFFNALQQGYTVIRANDGNALRERAIAGGTACKWIGRIHEYPEISPYVAFDPPDWSLIEHVKDHAASIEQQKRYLELLERECKGPDPLGRNHFYLARTQQALGIPSNNATWIAYNDSVAPEQAALAAYDFALVKDDPQWCGMALAKFPLAEAAWLLASIYYRRKEIDKAETWAMTAMTMLGHPRTVFNVRGDISEKCRAILADVGSPYAELF